MIDKVALRTYAELAGVTGDQLAEAAGCNRTSWYRLLNKTPDLIRLSSIAKIAQLLRIPVKAIINPTVWMLFDDAEQSGVQWIQVRSVSQLMHVDSALHHLELEEGESFRIVRSAVDFAYRLKQIRAAVKSKKEPYRYWEQIQSPTRAAFSEGRFTAKTLMNENVFRTLRALCYTGECYRGAVSAYGGNSLMGLLHPSAWNAFDRFLSKYLPFTDYGEIMAFPQMVVVRRQMLSLPIYTIDKNAVIEIRSAIETIFGQCDFSVPNTCKRLDEISRAEIERNPELAAHALPLLPKGGSTVTVPAIPPSLRKKRQ